MAKKANVLDAIDRKLSTEARLEEQRKEQALRDARKDVRHLLHEHDVAERKIKFLLGVKSHRSQTYAIPKGNGLSNEGTSVLCLSDVHLEERVDASTMNGLNEYNPDIAKDSVTRFFANGLRLHHIFRRDIKLNNVLLAILGDIINGYIHEEMVEDNYMSPTQATIMGLDLLESGIRYLLKHAEANVTVVCKFGNHGRTTEKSRISSGYKNSYEWMMYHMLAAKFEAEKRIRFIIDNGYLTYVTLYDRYDLRFHHGEAIKYRDGIGGITIPVNKAIAQWDKERPAYLDVFGHHHQQMLDSGKFVSNGSVVGYNPFAIHIRAPYQRPEQAYFIIDAERGKTVCAPILVR